MSFQAEFARGGPHFDRRRMLLGSAGALLGGVFAWPDRLVRSVQAASLAPLGGASDYKALVCVFLVGGNDSYNMIVPSSGSAYDSYAAARSNLALPKAQLLPVGAVGTPAQEMGFHPALPKLRQRFLSGDLAVLANVGTLNAPTTKADVLAKVPHLPAHLYSHVDQSRFWQATQAESLEARGWGGKLIEQLAALNVGSQLPAAISLGGANIWQMGVQTTPYAIGPTGSVAYQGFESGMGLARREVFDQLLALQHERRLVEAFAVQHQRATEFGEVVSEALSTAPQISAAFPANDDLADALKAIARLAAVHDQTGVARQVFYVRVDGFDTHTGHLAAQPELFAQLDNALGAFQDALDELGLANDVTTFTASEFGRSLSSNGKGCDHGWGGHQLVMGGAVAGGAAYGAWPEMVLDGPQDSGYGRLIPTTAADQMAASLAGWMGVSPGALGQMFPNLAQFSSSDLGFLI